VSQEVVSEAMERGSTQHGRLIDEEMAHDVSGLTSGAPVSGHERADLDPEAPVSAEVSSHLGATQTPDKDPEHLAVLERSELARWLLPSQFPADASVLVEGARSQSAPDEVLVVLERLDPTASFATFGALWRALGGDAETPEHDAAAHTDQPRPAPFAVPSSGIPEPTEPFVAGESKNVVGVAIDVATAPLRTAIAVASQMLRVARRVVTTH